MNCPYCDDPIGEEPTKDHFMPKSKGGCNHAHNIIICCLECNRGKSDMSPMEWLVRMKKINDVNWVQKAQAVMHCCYDSTIERQRKNIQANNKTIKDLRNREGISIDTKGTLANQRKQIIDLTKKNEKVQALTDENHQLKKELRELKKSLGVASD